MRKVSHYPSSGSAALDLFRKPISPLLLKDWCPPDSVGPRILRLTYLRVFCGLVLSISRWKKRFFPKTAAFSFFHISWSATASGHFAGSWPTDILRIYTLHRTWHSKASIGRHSTEQMTSKKSIISENDMVRGLYVVCHCMRSIIYLPPMFSHIRGESLNCTLN